jgi:hypothetical protein
MSGRFQAGLPEYQVDEQLEVSFAIISVSPECFIEYYVYTPEGDIRT